MQKIGSQIQVEKSQDGLKVEVYPKVEKKDRMLLNFWLLAWSICGLGVMLQLFIFWGEHVRSEKAFMFIYIMFWAYLEFKVLYAFRWNKNGKELIEIKDGKFVYTKLIGVRGLPVEMDVKSIDNFRYEESTEKGIWNDINRAAWMVGGEVIQYRFNDRIRRLGMKLNKKDAVKLVDLLNKILVKNK